ncbi:MAG: hypothetical protein AAF515_13035 [Pseudomonadota bacterium]
MAGVVLSLVLALLASAVLWLIIGPRLEVSPHVEQNRMLNFVVYFIGALPIAIAAVFYFFG